MTAQEIIERLQLQPHPAEGGYFAETYRSADVIPKGALPPRYPGPRAFGTAIYYLLTPEAVSAMHRLRTDEIFHFYLGDPVTMLWLRPDGTSEVLTLGPDILRDQRVQAVVPRGTWMGAFLKPGGRFALLGTTVAPGFECADYESGNRADLIRQCPGQRELILKLT